MRPDARRAATLPNVSLELQPFPDRAGMPDRDGVLGTDPNCQHCGGKGSIEGEPERGMAPGELHCPRTPCGCSAPAGFEAWREQLQADIDEAPSLRSLFTLLSRRGAYGLTVLDQLEGRIRRGEVERRGAEPPALNVWESSE